METIAHNLEWIGEQAAWVLEVAIIVAVVWIIGKIFLRGLLINARPAITGDWFVHAMGWIAAVAIGIIVLCAPIIFLLEGNHLAALLSCIPGSLILLVAIAWIIQRINKSHS